MLSAHVRLHMRNRQYNIYILCNITILLNRRPSITDTILSFVFTVLVGMCHIELVRAVYNLFDEIHSVQFGESVPGMKTATQMEITFIPRSHCFVYYYYYSSPCRRGRVRSSSALLTFVRHHIIIPLDRQMTIFSHFSL